MRLTREQSERFVDRYKNRYKEIDWLPVANDELFEIYERKEFLKELLGKQANRIYKVRPRGKETVLEKVFNNLWLHYWPVIKPRWIMTDWKWWNKIAKKLFKLCNEYWVDTTKVMVKEKYGRFDITCWWSDEFMDKIFKLEEKSLKTCMVCGLPWTPRSTGWIRTLCLWHYFIFLITKWKRKVFGI